MYAINVLKNRKKKCKKFQRVVRCSRHGSKQTNTERSKFSPRVNIGTLYFYIIILYIHNIDNLYDNKFTNTYTIEFVECRY